MPTVLSSLWLSTQTRHKVLIPAFTRALRDPFGPARVAGITAVITTSDFYKPSDVASRLLPPLCSLTLDPNRDVRNQVWYKEVVIPCV